MVSSKSVAVALVFTLVTGTGGPGLAQPTAPPAGACLERLPTDPVTLNLRDANVQTTLRILAQQYRVNMIVTDDVNVRVTLDFYRVPVRDVFGAIVETANLRCVVSGDVIRVSTMARLKAEEDDRQRQTESRQRLDAETRKKILEAQQAEEEFRQTQARGPVVEETIKLYYSDAEEVAKTVQGILGLPPEGRIAPVLPAQFQPPPPVNIPDRPQPLATAPMVEQSASSEALAKGLTVKAHKPTNSIFIRYYQRDLERIKKLIKESLDVALPQVQILGQMVIISRNALEQLGVQWGGSAIGQPVDGRNPAVVGRGFAPPPFGGGTPVVGTFSGNPNFTPNVPGAAGSATSPAGSSFLPVDPTSGTPLGSNLVNLPISALPTVVAGGPAGALLFGLIGSQFNVNLVIQALETQGKARRIAEPKIITVENSKAEMLRGFEVPFVTVTTLGVFGVGSGQVQFKEALLRLQVTPNVIREGNINKIRMKVLVENNEPDLSRTVLGNPFLFKRKAETEVVVTEGQRLVIGGVSIENAGTNLRQVPVLARIPVLGWLFKSREVSNDSEDLIVIITPSVVATQASGAPPAR